MEQLTKQKVEVYMGFNRRKPPVGRPMELTEEIVERIIKIMPESYIDSQVARLACVPPGRLQDWLAKGKEDFEVGKDSIYAQLAIRHNLEKGKIVKYLIGIMLAKGAWQAALELLKSVVPSDFGKEAELYKRLLDDYQKLVDDMIKLKSPRGQNNESRSENESSTEGQQKSGDDEESKEEVSEESKES